MNFWRGVLVSWSVSGWGGFGFGVVFFFSFHSWREIERQREGGRSGVAGGYSNWGEGDCNVIDGLGYPLQLR